MLEGVRETGGERRRAGDGDRWLFLVCAAAVAFHLSFAGRYGFFRDELYFIACGARPSPSATPINRRCSHRSRTGWDALVGGSPFGFRVLPACAPARSRGRRASRAGPRRRPERAVLAAAGGWHRARVHGGYPPVHRQHAGAVALEIPCSCCSVLVCSSARRLPGWLGVGARWRWGRPSNKYSMAFWALALALGVGLTEPASAALLASAGLVLGGARRLPGWRGRARVASPAHGGLPPARPAGAGAAGKNAPLSRARWGFLTESACCRCTR